MPMPLSLKVSSPFSASSVTVTRQSSSAPGESIFCLVMASQPLETISRIKMSLSEYSHRLMIGIMFCAWMEILPC